MTIRVSLGDFNKAQNCNDAWAAIQDIKWLKFHLPSLKSCVLTLELGLPMRMVHEPEVPGFDRRFLGTPCKPIMRDPSHDLRTLSDGSARPFNLTSLQWTKAVDDDCNVFETSLVTEASNLLDAFVSKGPGKLQFVRIRWFSDASYDVCTGEPVHYGPLVKVDCEKMAPEPEKGSFGTQLFEAAYRLSRTCEQKAASARMLRQC